MDFRAKHIDRTVFASMQDQNERVRVASELQVEESLFAGEIDIDTLWKLKLLLGDRLRVVR